MQDYLFEQPKKKKISVTNTIITRHLGFVIILFLTVGVLFVQHSSFLSAETTEQLESQIDDKKAEIDEIAVSYTH